MDYLKYFIKTLNDTYQVKKGIDENGNVNEDGGINTIDTCVDGLFLYDDYFHEKRREMPNIYGVCIPDSNFWKKRLFDSVDSCGDKICHIMPSAVYIPMFEGTYRIYIYVKSDISAELFSRYDIPAGEILHSIRFRDYFSLDRFQDTRTIYCKTDYLLNGSFGKWLHQQVLQNSSNPDFKIVLITGSADFSIDDRIVQYMGSHVAFWFGTNIVTHMNHVHGLPLGITSYDPRSTSSSFLFEYGDTSDYHKILADDSCIINIWDKLKIRLHKVYMNFSLGTYPDRSRIWNMYKNNDLVVAKSHACTLEARADYFKDLCQSEFSICPRGNGIDTHRFWETLYCGTFPIIEKNRVYEFFEGLPFVSVDSWKSDVITEDFLDSVDPRDKNIDAWNYHKLYTSYWIEQIERKSVLIYKNE